MLVIGLTGGIGSGKSTVAKFFAELGVDIIDTDQLAREVVEPKTKGLEQIVAHFGEQILDASHSLNRKKLREIVFNDPTERIWLEHLLHPMIREKTREYAQKATSSYCIVVIPLLVESSISNPLINRILVVDAPEAEQIERTQQRDQLPREQIEAVLQAQANRAKRLAAADDIILNDQDLAYLKQQVLNLHQQYLQLASSSTREQK